MAMTMVMMKANQHITTSQNPVRMQRLVLITSSSTIKEMKIGVGYSLSAILLFLMVGTDIEMH